jgi:hypothetical protein
MILYDIILWNYVLFLFRGYVYIVTLWLFNIAMENHHF